MFDTLKQTILIVDDSQDNVRILAKLFANEFNVKIALNGQEAIRIAETEPQPDIILLDVMMPELDGYQICRYLKEGALTREIPIVFITAMDQEQDEEYGLELGAIDYILKPIKPAIVRARIRNQLELKRLRDILRSQSMLDGLTGLANRRRFDEAMYSEWHRALRHQQALGLILIDIDFFKNYNDRYGHLAGDDCLKAVSQALKANIRRAHDLVARWGGEEFICLLPDATLETTLRIAEQVRQAVEKMQLEHKASVTLPVVTISLGAVATVPADDQTIEGFIQKADEALYRAKAEGKNRTCY
ncbi:MAG: diguanylate cyclase [Spirochaetes bacterium]|nr:diguanylate cyclase [Spirochaetota bacterium]MBU0954643.1 diguanylate cyclase [Spirochaetota bacterium]